ncbi:autoinducer binding domain-containing protein [Aestuariivirga litoralis]|uniref:autoinducer binding domain-containing protein n=1 Tax=Aestuariivirga litoralis TaxID=2650924 RepID=UPI0018C8424B|nr:autoinducer binding domain-containing protein [Aestuariivirga litoralis]MBG1231360.1 hypothetical protein [Aestuariivirga litoralis]
MSRPFRSIEEATSFLTRAATEEGVSHLSYWYLQYSEGAPDQVIWVATYDPHYMQHYMSNFTPLSDPVINSVMDNKLVDWAEWFKVDHVAQAVDHIANRYGITKFGISMPLPAPGEDKIIFSVNTASSESEWAKMRGALVKRFQPFAREFDERMRPLVAQVEKGDSVFKLSA